MSNKVEELLSKKLIFPKIYGEPSAFHTLENCTIIIAVGCYFPQMTCLPLKENFKGASTVCIKYYCPNIYIFKFLSYSLAVPN